MTKILFLHGNAGTHHDAHPLQQLLLNSGIPIDEFLTPDLYSQRALHTLLAGKDWIIITHSWGCYFLLNQIEEIEHHIGKLIFVNPYVLPESPLSLPAQLLLQTPLIGQGLLQNSHRKQKESFVAKMLAPASVAEVPHSTELRNQVNSFHLWEKAAENKIYQQNNPLPLHELTDLPAVALVGEDDQVCDNNKQLKALKVMVPNLKINEFTNAGHGLLWTHLNEISKEVSL